MKKLSSISICFKHVNEEDFYYETYYFAFCSKDFKQATEFHECRECLINELTNKYCTQIGSENLDLNATRILVLMNTRTWRDKTLTENRTKKEVFRALNIIHCFERAAKWPLTKIYKIDNCPKDTPIYLFKADKKWQKSPYTLSLYLLLIRSGRYKELDKCRSRKSIEKAWTNIYKKKPEFRPESTESLGHDRFFLSPLIFKRSILLMKNFEKLFGRTSASKLFHEAEDRVYGYKGEGIQDLCDSDISDIFDEKLSDKFRKLCERYKT